MTRMTSYEEWEEHVPEELKQDSLWKVTAYRLALLAGDLGWEDVRQISRTRHLWGIADQLYRALGSVGANLAEGYSRSTGKDRARFYEYALGSARESREWYYKARHALDQTVYHHRLELLTRVIQLLIATIPKQRLTGIRDSSEQYDASGINQWLATTAIPAIDGDS